MSSPADEPLQRATERLVLWHRAVSAAGPEAETLAWRGRVDTRLEVAGGERLLHAGASVAYSFDPLELDDVIELALDLLRDARSEASHLEVGCGLALGALLVDPGTGAPSGSVLDRAQLLANRAQGDQLVLDEPCSSRAQESYLFTRDDVTGSIEGRVLDAQHPRKRECRRALALLHQAPLPPSARKAFERLAELAATPGPIRIALRSAVPYVALERLARLKELLGPPLVLRLSRMAGGLQPLGGLSLALRRAQQRDGAALVSAGEDALNIARGAAVGRERAVAALQGLLAHATARGGRPWLVLERPVELDPASLAVVIEALARSPTECVVFSTLDERSSVPVPLAASGELVELQLEPLMERDRPAVAAAMLGLEPESPIAQTLARLGGDTLLGIAEATRTLVSSGDLVHDSDGFRWRAQPRHAALPIPIDGLMAERVAGLEANAQRALEALCIAPPSAAGASIEQIALLDGLNEANLTAGLAQLAEEGWHDRDGSLGPLEQAVRTAVRNGMPPSRAAELHRFVAEALRAQDIEPERPSFAHALLAHHLAEGGREREAAEALLDAARAAIESGFPRMAVRLAAVARKLDGSSEIMARARHVVGLLDASASTTATLPPEAEITPPRHSTRPGDATLRRSDSPRHMAGAAMRAATAAIAEGELDAAEGLIDTAVAAGWDRAAAQRISSVLHLRRGQVPEAVRALKQARVPNADPHTRCRDAIAAALILLESGEAMDALRSGLEALASARRDADHRGEHVALRVLSDCLRALGRDVDAERVDNAARASASTPEG